MSEHEESIKVKDPKKVERGKKLGAISQMAKSKKRLSETLRRKEMEEEEDDGKSTIFYVVMGVVVAGGLGYLYFNYKPTVILVEPIVVSTRETLRSGKPKQCDFDEL